MNQPPNLAQNPDEPLPVVDEQDRQVGVARRADIHARGLRHRSAHVLVFDGRARLYLQRRSLGKDSHPGKWTTSASGHVDPGESYEQAARRELAEELALAGEPRFLAKLAAGPATENEFAAVFWLVSDQRPRPNPLEISEGAFFTREQAVELGRDPTRATPSLGVVLELLDRLGAWPSP